MNFLQKNTFEPKMVNRWMIEFPSEYKIDSFIIHKTSRPEFKYNIFGKKIYKPIDIYLYDQIGPSTAMGIDRMVKQLNPKCFLEKLLGFEKTFNYTLKILDPVGYEVERWSINKCTIIGVKYGELDYKESDVLKIKLTIQPKEVKLIL